MPGLANLASTPIAWLDALIGAADRAVRRYLKRDIELQSYRQAYSGENQRDIYLRQFPVWMAQTSIKGGSASDGALLPQSTIIVNSVQGFHPGLMGDTSAVKPTIGVQIGVSSWTWVEYTGTTRTGINSATEDSFTGCTLGGPAGTMLASYAKGISSPVVFYDPGGYFGQTPQGLFQAPANSQTQMVLGTQFVVVTDDTLKQSERGLLRRIGGSGQGFVGAFPENMYSGKLAAYRLPTWPRGDGNIAVFYASGYAPLGSGYKPSVPEDIQWATAALVAYMVRIYPYGGMGIQSENLGSYSYSLFGPRNLEIPELGSIARSLAPYRESAW